MKDIKSIIIAALLVIAGGGIAYFLYSSGGEVKQPKQDTGIEDVGHQSCSA